MTKAKYIDCYNRPIGNRWYRDKHGTLMRVSTKDNGRFAVFDFGLRRSYQLSASDAKTFRKAYASDADKEIVRIEKKRKDLAAQIALLQEQRDLDRQETARKKAARKKK